MPPEFVSRPIRPTRATVLVVAVVAVVTFLPAWSFPFVYDDIPIVRDNPVVRGDRPLWSVLTEAYWSGTPSPDPLYRPLTTGSLRLNYAIFGNSPMAFHVVNSMLHACVAVLVAVLATRLWSSRSAGCVAALVFAAHPVATEAVVPVVGRSELLALLFILLLLIVRLTAAADRRPPSTRHHLLVSGLFTCACASKEHAVAAVCAVVAVDWVFMDRTAGLRPRLVRLVRSHYLGLIVVLAGFFFVRWCLFGANTSLPPYLTDPAKSPLPFVDGTTRLATPFVLWALSAKAIAWPVNLCPIWGVGSFELPGGFARPDVVVGIVLVVIALSVMFVLVKRRSPAAIPLALAGVVLLSACHFLPGANYMFAERWLYTPVAMLLIAVAGLARLAPRTSVVIAAISATACALISLDYQKCFRSDEALVRSVLARQPQNIQALFGLYAICDERNDLAEAGRTAADLVRYHPGIGRSWLYYAEALANQEKFDESDAALRRYIETAGAAAVSARARDLSDRIRAGQSRRLTKPR